MKEPIYKEIIAKMKDDILRLAPNTPITPERDLATLFNTSRMTIRKSINNLIDDGYLYRDGNKGTFVSDKKIIRRNTSLNFLSNDKEDIKYNLIYFSRKDCIYEKDILINLDINEDEPVIRVVKKNFVKTRDEKKTRDIEEIYVVYKRIGCKVELSKEKFINFEEIIETGRINQKFIPMIVPPKYANILGVDMNTPIIMTETIIFDKRAIPIAFIKTYNNPKEKEIMIIT